MVDDVGVAEAGVDGQAEMIVIALLHSRLAAVKARREDGSLSLFFAVTTVGLLLVMGLLVDGGGALNSSSRAESLAQEAARTAGQQLDPAQAIQGTAITIDADAAQGAAQDYLAAEGVQGDVQISDDGQTMTVTVHDTYSTYFAQLLGKATIDVTGSATAQLQTQAGD
ncbi:pilus assembly protein TadG-related protein [Streptomyces sp. 2A115]|uniref:pilus assembly protein TadG-related protein n=1 Tax=Streptomyces sp. 2A115 TaxID=3457439 RepID=UPI003FD15258